MVGSGLLTYAFHVLAARRLGPHAYGQVGVLWAAMFLGVVVFFRPLEQTASRTIADRLARGDEARTVLRAVGVIAVAVLAAMAAGGALGWRLITDSLFLGNDAMTAMLLGGIALYGLAYLVRGLVGGVRWFGGYSIALMADSVVRLAAAAPLLFVASQSIASAAVVAAAAGSLVVLLFGGRRLQPIFARRPGAPFRLRTAVAFATPAGVIAGADQLLVNGAPLLVVVGGGGEASKAAGIVFAATMLVRVPVYVFQGLAASLLPNLTHMQARDDAARLRRAVVQTAAFLLGAGGIIVIGAATIGPRVTSLLYGPGFEAGRVQLALLAAGVGCYLAASTFSQALLAVGAATRAAAAWAATAGLFVALYAALPGTPLTRVSVTFAAAAFVDLLLLAVLLLRSGGRR
jgi:O-antigen/teichoic acid export membrane protein